MTALQSHLGSAGQAASTAINTAGTVATIGAQSGWWLSAAAVPVIGAAVAGVTLGLQLLFNRKGPQQKVASTKIVDELEPLLKNNVEAYISGPRTRSSQAAALQNFDDAWAWLSGAEACGNPALGNPGKACLSDRARGGKWDWFARYRDPISEDAGVNDDPVQDALSQIIPELTPETSDQLGQLLPFALIALALAL
jgi:hypothetical protein